MSTPESFGMPADEDNEHTGQSTCQPNSPGHTVPSRAGDGSAVYNTPTTSPIAPGVDPSLLHMSHPNNSLIAQTRDPMPTSPNPYASEREPSPLSSPPDEETAAETIGAPSSYPKKRKSAKNNAGKGKAPPKQRRKTTESSQSRGGAQN
jgi:hypothetical protein